jgi:hypothetical protein
MKTFLIWLGFCTLCLGGDRGIIYRFAQGEAVLTVKEGIVLSGKGSPWLYVSLAEGERSSVHAHAAGKLMGLLMEGPARTTTVSYGPTVREVKSRIFVAFHNDGRIGIWCMQNGSDAKPWLEITMSEAEAHKLASSIRIYLEEARLKRLEQR